MDPQPFSFLNLVESKLSTMDKAVHSISSGDAIRIIDTPHMWGMGMNQGSVAACAANALKDFSASVERMVSGGVNLVDIVSLNPPTGSFLEAIMTGLQVLASKIEDWPHRTVVRFLFGFVPVQGTVNSFVSDLCKFCAQKKLPTDKLTILVGELYKPTKTSWNHAKIIAADGKVAIVGGHNLWAESYGTYPPVHDISVQVIGQAARHAQDFAGWLWQQGGDNLEVRQITTDYQQKTLAPGPARDQLCVIELVDDYYRLMPDEKYRWCSGRVLTLGRGGVLGSNASDVAKETLILGAQHSLKICQQDLFFTGFTDLVDHKVCYWIAEALLAKPRLTIDIVVSPISAATHGAQYSWGHGGTGTFTALRDIITEKTKKISSHPSLVATAMNRLRVAPFCFTDVTFETEGKDYFWPNAPATSVIGRFNPGDKTPLGFTYQPAPGNHAKVYIVDDSCYYIGSDNLYPHDLAEFGFLIEGDSVADLLQNYWNLLWKYSSQHVVKL